MKTVTKQQAADDFNVIANLAYAGETVIVTHAGKPWVKLISASRIRRGKSAAAFKTRLNRISRKPIPGVSEVFNRARR